MRDRTDTITIEGVTIRYDLDTRRVWYMSDWAKGYALSREGTRIVREFVPGHGDPYAQADIYYVV